MDMLTVTGSDVENTDKLKYVNLSLICRNSKSEIFQEKTFKDFEVL
jgi:hypothetical protein